MSKNNTIGIISLNQPGFSSSLNIINDLLLIDPHFNIILYTKSDNNNFLSENIKFKQFSNINSIVDEAWKTCKILIWFTSTGIVIRKIAHLINNKLTDPAILVINLSLTQIIPLLSGHIGGANELATQLASVNKNYSVFITTATDSTGTFAIDLFCKKYDLFIENIEKLASVSNQLVNNKDINLVSYDSIWYLINKEEIGSNLINRFDINNNEKAVNSLSDIIIATKSYNHKHSHYKNILKISLPKISIGIGINKNTPYQELEENFYCFINQNNIFLDDIEFLASFEGKKNDLSLQELSFNLGKKIIFYDKTEIKRISSYYEFSKSEAQRYFEIPGVAEPSSILASQHKKLLIPKIKFKNTTFAAAF